MTTETKKTKISPEDYKRILEGLELISISMKDCKAFINTDLIQPPELSIQIEDKASFKLKDQGVVHIFHNYKIEAKKQGSKSKFLSIEVTFLVKILSKKEFTNDFFDIYKDVSLRLNTWPYLREFVNQITLRMNIPPLILPFFKTP